MMALTFTMAAVGLTALALPIAVESPQLAGKDANYILGFAVGVFALAIVALARYIRDMHKSLVDITKQSTESQTRVADALMANTAVINECHRRSLQ